MRSLAKALNSHINVEMDSPCYLNQLKKLCRYMISDSFGLWCFLVASTKSVYELSSNLSGATKLGSSLYAFGLMTVRRITFLCVCHGCRCSEEVLQSLEILDVPPKEPPPEEAL